MIRIIEREERLCEELSRGNGIEKGLPEAYLGGMDISTCRQKC